MQERPLKIRQAELLPRRRWETGNCFVNRSQLCALTKSGPREAGSGQSYEDKVVSPRTVPLDTQDIGSGRASSPPESQEELPLGDAPSHLNSGYQPKPRLDFLPGNGIDTPIAVSSCASDTATAHFILQMYGAQSSPLCTTIHRSRPSA